MNRYFDGKIANQLKDEETSLTVFKKNEKCWEKLLDPFYAPDLQRIPRIESWEKSVTISLALNKPTEGKVCKVRNVENGSITGPHRVGRFKWELEIVSGFDKWQDPNGMSFDIEIMEEKS